MTSSEPVKSEKINNQIWQSAIDCVNRRSQGSSLSPAACVTLNFHPDTCYNNQTLLSILASEGIYRSQFETGTSNGSVSAFAGGRRYEWEQQLFGGAYDAAPSQLRPKYGALNYKGCVFGGAPRFGSAHLRLVSAVNKRCTFAYPDSHLNPERFGTSERMDLIALADENATELEFLDNYIEAHVHGIVNIEEDVDAVVLDPCYRNTSIESAARNLACKLEWHSGYSLSKDKHRFLADYRGQHVADFIAQIATDEALTPAVLGRYRNGSVDAQTVKKAWHCLARFGRDSA